MFLKFLKSLLSGKHSDQKHQSVHSDKTHGTAVPPPLSSPAHLKRTKSVSKVLTMKEFFDLARDFGETLPEHCKQLPINQGLTIERFVAAAMEGSYEALKTTKSTLSACTNISHPLPSLAQPKRTTSVSKLDLKNMLGTRKRLCNEGFSSSRHLACSQSIDLEGMFRTRSRL
jgi:hypothetical protein